MTSTPQRSPLPFSLEMHRTPQGRRKTKCKAMAKAPKTDKSPAPKPAKKHGGPRPHSGRPKGGVSQVTKSIREYVAANNCDPLQAIADLMVWHHNEFKKAAKRFEANAADEDALKIALAMSERAADYAAKLGPYCAPRLAAVEASITGDVGVTIQIVRQGQAEG
jgi:hypothetical protein